jgi:hypothetical protein
MSGESDDRLRRVGDNEALYRQVNERIKELNQGFGSITGTFAIACECGNLGCAEHLRVTPQVYEQTRADPTHFIVTPGHQTDDLEVVVAQNDDFVITEKAPLRARDLAKETDPRT